MSVQRPDQPGIFRVYAVQYASRQGLRGQHFHGLANAWGEPHPTAYFVWVALSGDRTIVIDAGIDPERASAVPGLRYRGSPPALLAELGIEAAVVDTVVLTHLHYDHTGTVDEFPGATVVIQQRELDYWTGPVAARIVRERWLVEPRNVAFVQKAVMEGRAVVVDGDAEPCPGVGVHFVGGHTAGMQIVSFRTSLGRVVVASDAAHYYENIEDDRPFEILHDVPGMYAGFDRINQIADSPSLIAAGHDPAVFERFPTLDGAPHVAVIA